MFPYLLLGISWHTQKGNQYKVGNFQDCWCVTFQRFFFQNQKVSVGDTD